MCAVHQWVFGCDQSLAANRCLPAAPAALVPQVFVANPNKTRPVVDILYNNKEKLLKYLDDFHNDRGARLWAGEVFEYTSRCSLGVRQGFKHLPTAAADAACAEAEQRPSSSRTRSSSQRCC